MCIGIAIIGIVPESGPIQFFGKNGNSSHDIILSECVQVELHNRSFKIEYIFPNQLRLDAPDDACRAQAIELGIADINFGVVTLKLDILAQALNWLQVSNLKHDKTTMHRADLSGANLSGANLSGANLFRANLSGADLSGANLSGADLSGADLTRADLSEADLSEADLSGANLFRANLSGADLSGADLSGADLTRANLSEADLSGADLTRVDISDEQKEIAKKRK